MLQNSIKEIAAVLPAVSEGLEERLALFAEQSGLLTSRFLLKETEGEALEALRALAEAEGWKAVATHRTPLTEAALAALKPLELSVCDTSGPYEKEELAACDAAITGCDALIAQSGSVLVSSRSAGGRALSVLPPHHVVLAGKEQLLADLPSAFAFLRSAYGEAPPSFISLITGPSRTGDIERILVLGAHGPKKLTIVCF